LLRLEADEVPSGGLAMGIFPVRKARRGCCFKLRIDGVCNFERELSMGGRVPSVGFTESSPFDMDNMGGLPSRSDLVAKSIWIEGDGQVFVQNAVDGSSSRLAIAKGEPTISHVLNEKDSIEYFWCDGFVEVTVNGEAIYSISHANLPTPPKKPVYALIDCCHAVCKVTAMA